MGREAIIDKNGVVENIIEGHIDGSIPCPAETAIGWNYDTASGIFSASAIATAVAAAAKRLEIERGRDAACIADVVVNGHTWQADARSQFLLSNAIRRAHAGRPLPPVWRDAANVDVPIAAVADLEAIEDAIAANTQAAYSASWQLKAQVDTLEKSDDSDGIQLLKVQY